MLLAEYHLFQKYEINDAGYRWALYNMFHLLSLEELAARYLNYEIFGMVVHERTIAAGTIVGVLLLASAGILLEAHFVGQRRGRRLSGWIDRGLERLRGLRRPRGVFRYECRKLWIYQGGILFLAAFVLFLGNLRTPVQHQERQEALLSLYTREYAGALSEDTFRQIRLEGERALEEYQEALASEAWADTLEYKAARYGALEELTARYETLLRLQGNGTKGLQLVDYQPYECVYGDTGEELRRTESAAVLLLLCFLLAEIFSMEHQAGMKGSLLAAPGGRGTLWNRKVQAAVLAAGFVWLCWVLRDLTMLLSSGAELLAWKACGLSLMFWQEEPGMLCLGGRLLLMALFRLAGILSAALGILFLGTRIPVYLAVAGSAALVLLLPAVLFLLGAEFLAPVSWAFALAGRFAPDTGAWVWLAVWIILGGLAAVLGEKSWRRYGG